jgi:predicted acyltransferase
MRRTPVSRAMPGRHHLTSLDVFRGLAITAMIVVNNPGNWSAVYPPLTHAHWHGWTFADMVFPSFIFIAGVALPFSRAARARPHPSPAALGAVARRALLLVALGIALNAAATLSDAAAVRIPGVLQRIGLAYAIAAPLVIWVGVRGWVASAAGLLAIHTLLLVGVAVGGDAAGTMTPEHNVAGAVDAAVFGRHRLMPADPEGLLGVLSTAATMLCGAVAGAWLRATSDPMRAVAGLAAGGALVLGTGLLWSAWLPLNKTLWTGSFAVAAAGGSALVLAACALLVDVLDVAAWARPFVWLGVNPLAIYCLSELARRLLDVGWIRMGTDDVGVKDAFFWMYFARLTGATGGALASLLFALLVACVWIGVAGVLHRRHIRLRV